MVSYINAIAPLMDIIFYYPAQSRENFFYFSPLSLEMKSFEVLLYRQLRWNGEYSKLHTDLFSVLLSGSALLMPLLQLHNLVKFRSPSNDRYDSIYTYVALIYSNFEV